MKINVLDKRVYNRIAAGEVVERPFSVRKELVENSIDAGSKNISISIWNGGKDRVEIEDDGCGIEKSELVKAFLPHATSKIADVDDLDSISTLGFRGEALASIASVAKVTIVSKPVAQEFGAKIYSDGGNVFPVEDAPSKDGTKITVDSLFFNTPVRAKFLKSTRAEEGDITDIVGRLVLANPYISFKYFIDDKLVLQSYGGGEEEALLAVYGANTLKNCFEIETEKNGVGVRGYIGRHNFTKANRTYQTLIINGRYVINSTVSVAVQNAYQAYLMKRQYPFFVLYLNVPCGEVDVNVHPNKTDVRFTNNQIIYSAVYSVVSKVLDGSNEALEIVKNCFPLADAPSCEQAEAEAVENKAEKEEKQKPIKEESKGYKKAGPKAVYENGSNFYLSFTSVMDSASEKTEEKKPEVDIFAENKKFIEELERKKSLEADNTAEEKFEQKGNYLKSEKKQNDIFAFVESKKENLSANNSKQQDMGVREDFVYVGQAMKIYLIFERGGDLYFIDQHAAHERLLFDALYEKTLSGNKASQQLLVPYVLNLNSVERAYFETRLDYLAELGFVIDEFGGDSYKITEVPLEVADLKRGAFFD